MHQISENSMVADSVHFGSSYLMSGHFVKFVNAAGPPVG